MPRKKPVKAEPKRRQRRRKPAYDVPKVTTSTAWDEKNAQTRDRESIRAAHSALDASQHLELGRTVINWLKAKLR